jgi:hypothetical protein
MKEMETYDRVLLIKRGISITNAQHMHVRIQEI